MGVQEASAWSSTAEFLELAVVGGDLVPGRRGWKTPSRNLCEPTSISPKPDCSGRRWPR
jgi:hypothetical protein